MGAATLGTSWAAYVEVLARGIGAPLPPHLVALPIGSVELNPMAGSIVALMGTMALNGISMSAIFTSVVTAAKVLLVICVVLAGFAHSNWPMWQEQPFLPNGVPGLLDGAVKVFYAYIGFDAMASTAEETVSPTSTVPYAIIIAMLLSMLIYAVLALAVTSMVPYGTLSKTAPA